jgi:hypothetical protein
MKPTDAVVLKEYVKACCPQQRFTEYTSDAWFDLLGDLDLDDCKQAVQAIAKRQPFVAPAEIRAEVRRARELRLARTPLPAPPAELADEPGRYQLAVRQGIKRIADGMDIRTALPAGEPLPGDPPAEWQQAREAIAEVKPIRPDPRDVAREQAEQSRKLRGEDAS